MAKGSPLPCGSVAGSAAVASCTPAVNGRSLLYRCHGFPPQQRCKLGCRASYQRYRVRAFLPAAGRRVSGRQLAVTYVIIPHASRPVGGFATSGRSVARTRSCAAGRPFGGARRVPVGHLLPHVRQCALGQGPNGTVAPTVRIPAQNIRVMRFAGAPIERTPLLGERRTIAAGLGALLACVVLVQCSATQPPPCPAHHRRSHRPRRPRRRRPARRPHQPP